jgi:hypothetical protein
MARQKVFPRTLLIGLVALTTVVGGAPGALASIAHPRVVGTNPADFTPNVVDDAVASNAAVHALAQGGGLIYAGGTFRTVQNAARTQTFTRFNLMSFSSTTGSVTSFAPTVNGTVWALAVNGPSLYVAGTFTTVNGTTRRGIAKTHATTGAVDTAFNAALPSGGVTEVRLVGGRLLVAGTFPKRLAALDPATGRDTGYLDLGISGTVASNAGTTEVYRFAVNPAGTRLIAVGNFTTVAGQMRYRAFMVDLGPSSGSLSSWRYQPLERMCASSSLPDYLRDVDFSPDGQYFVIVSTGFVPRTPTEIGTSLCDAAARFETNVANAVRPTWINYTGGDTLHAVAATGVAVYVQGHQRWLDNPFGRDSAGPGAVPRPGIAAIDPATGKALPWNPTKSRDVGGKDFLVTLAGLWVASDGRFFNNELRWGIAFCPL